MTIAMDIEIKLHELNFHIKSVRQIAFAQQIKLTCGAVVTTFDTGKVLVQGKFLPSSRDESLALLKQALPPETIWGIS
ncbi:hypothetical protein [Rhodoferax sp.]|uniref:hypothetical protein n=1 Tax=Rhodoferax sp. TaxID=50421 RepID=UPI00274D86B9|nr:hypothetical protein [Rhodoferax sp.]